MWSRVLAVTGCLVLGCSGPSSPVATEVVVTSILPDGGKKVGHESIAPDDLAGVFSKQWFLGRFTLTLREDRTFDYEQTGCFGVCGQASGSWAIEGNGLKMNVESSQGTLAETSLGQIGIARIQGQFLLVAADDRDSFEKCGPNENWCFARKESLPVFDDYRNAIAARSSQKAEPGVGADSR